MSPQSEGRPSIERPRHVQDGGYRARSSQRQKTSDLVSRYPSQSTNGLESVEVPKQQLGGGVAAGDDMSNGTSPVSPANGRNGRETEVSQDIPVRGRSRTEGSVGGNASGGTSRLCTKCGEPLTAQYVRALNGTFHLQCFMCRDCGEVVASKFFPVEDPDGGPEYPLCEIDYFRRINLLCHHCGGALRGSYITALDRKYHVEHFTCTACPTVFGAQDSYYEHDDKVYCHYHYSTQFAQRCTGCQTAILKQFVEIFRNGENQHWHPECYMIHKFWNVRLALSGTDTAEKVLYDEQPTEEKRLMVREEEDLMESKVYRIWSVLSTFEESSAACISDMLLHVSNGAYVDGVLVAKKFIWHVDILFGATDRLDALVASHNNAKGLSNGREAKLLCKKIVAFFSLLTKTQETGVRKLGVTQELLSLVTGLAHYLKLLIRISLQGALKLEREWRRVEGLHGFLEELSNFENTKDSGKSLDLTAGVSGLADQQSDICTRCRQPIEDECLRFGQQRWHGKHVVCDHCQRSLGEATDDALWSAKEGQVICRDCNDEKHHIPDAVVGFEQVTRLQQYVYLLRVALARLLSVLRSGGTLPHTSDDPNLTTYDSNEGHRIAPGDKLNAPLLRSGSRSKSYGDTSAVDTNEGSSYEQTVGEMKRLRSTRMDTQLSTTLKKFRTSRIIDGPEGRSTRPGSAGVDGSNQGNQGFHIIEDRDANGEATTDLTFGNQDALTLDDIPRIVAAEQAKEQRPNAYKHARNQMFGSGSRTPRLVSGHQRGVSAGNGLDINAAGGSSVQRNKRYFSELSALEYFIVRHVAVLSMEPLLQGHYNLEELLGLIETRKPTFWGKFGKAFKNDRTKLGKKKGVFGVSLDTLVERDGVESTYGVGPGALRVPGIIDDAISAMRQMDMSVEGVFRKNGNIRGLKDLTERIDAKEVEVDLSKENPVQVAALLKKFLRELPDPLLTHKLYRLFITSQKIPDEEKRRRVLHLTCCLLPKSHRDSLEILFSFLVWASSFSQVDEETGSKMDTHNLATVITPNILKEKSEKVGMDEINFLAIEAVNSLIEYNDQMCEVPEDIQSILNDTPLFSNTSEVTTKEILKRYGDIVRSPAHRPLITDPSDIRPSSSTKTHANAASTLQNGRSRAGHSPGPSGPRAAAPVITHVDVDPFHAHTWPRESSVRHVQEPSTTTPANAPTNANPNNNHNTNINDTAPPQSHHDLANPNSTYHRRASSDDSQTSPGSTPHRQSYRHSGWGRRGGAMGVTGAG
ncbi:hypothetical protein MMC07_008891 [Pseudocyphellaria aurata]|nr:hypothetical protein [Pseudocyphellaria aurata]